MRVFAGPNGSGKSTIVPMVVSVIEEKRLGIYVNADNIEKELNDQGFLNFSDFQLEISEDSTRDFFRQSSFSPVYRGEPDLWKMVSVNQNIFQFAGKIDSYLAADLADFIRNSLLRAGISFTFETVMSHEGKLDFFRFARELDYKVYLYYIATEDPDINISRVKLRVFKNGHPVSDEAIKKRYYKSLKNLREAVKLCYRSYLFDNSGKVAELIAEVKQGTDLHLIDPDRVPLWVEQYLLQIDN